MLPFRERTFYVVFLFVCLFMLCYVMLVNLLVSLFVFAIFRWFGLRLVWYGCLFVGWLDSIPAAAQVSNIPWTSLHIHCYQHLVFRLLHLEDR